MLLGLHSLLPYVISDAGKSDLQDVGPWREQDAEATKAATASIYFVYCT